MHENEFFICKAIGWALRQYSYTTAPKAVIQFVKEYSNVLSPLSTTEALKALNRNGYILMGTVKNNQTSIYLSAL